MSSNNLTAEEEAKLTHRKSSSFSNSQFREMSSPNFKRHRKTQSDSKKSIINTLKSNSFSHSDNNTTNTTNRSGRDIEQNSNRISLYVQMNKNVKGFNIERKQTNPPSQLKVTTTSTQSLSTNVDTPVASSQLNLSRMISLFVLVLLLLSGFLFTPK